VATATSEYVCGYLIRVHPAGGRHGDAYDAVCLAVPRQTTAVVLGLLSRTDSYRGMREYVAAVEDHLRDLGFTRMRYERRRGGRVIPFEKDL
jgi:hypothetical protein